MAERRKDNPRKTAVEILNRIDEKGAFAEPMLDAVLTRGSLNDIHDRRLVTQLVYGTLRMRGSLDWVIDRFYKGKPEELDITIRNILRISLFQFFFTERIPDFAIVDEAVRVGKDMRPRGSGLVNALLRTVIRQRSEIVLSSVGDNPAENVSIAHSHPLWMVERWVDMLGLEESIELCKANNDVPPVTLRVNRLKTTREKLGKELVEEGYDIRAADYCPDGLLADRLPGAVRTLRHFREGCFQIQDEASQLITYLVDPQPGERIMDVCSGVGIKTTHLAEKMGNEGTIVALDIYHNKLKALKGLAKRLGVSIIDTLQGDATREVEEHLRGLFDRVLVDAPCSGLGTLRRNPEIKWRVTPEDITSFSDVQREILNRAAAYLKRGGLLIYSTCTITPEENDDVVLSFLDVNKEFSLLRPPAAIDDRMIDARGFFRSFPHRHGTDGFFGAILKKTSCLAGRQNTLTSPSQKC